MSILDNPMLLSICLITYNHEKYISKALDSILMQKVNFSYEIVIGEDCSKDNTRGILLEYQARHPEKIRLLLREKNMGLMNNFIDTYKSCRGKYIATMDGDDYWVSPDKLQKQVDFLDQHLDFAICFHPVFVFYEEENHKPGVIWPNAPKEVSTIKDLLEDNFIPTAAAVFRNGLFGEFPEGIQLLLMEDWPLHVLNAQHGRIGCLNEIMGAYRVHSGGMWSSLKEISTYLEHIKFYKWVDTHLKYIYHDIINRRLDDRYLKLANLYENQGNIHKARSYAMKRLALFHFDKNNPNYVQYLPKIKSLIRLYFPSFYKTLKNTHVLITKYL
jgi:glycosyltransferase involved in cell wall biosynthesis